MRRTFGVLALSMLLGALTLARADITIYNSIPNPLPPNVPSLGYQAQQTAELGQLVNFASNYRDLTKVTVAMSDWALHSDYPLLPNSGFSVPLTLNLYNVGVGGLPGSLIASRTVDATIPWRPEPDGCSDASSYTGSDGGCYHGSLSTVEFDFTGVTVTDQIIYGLAFSTETWGSHPTGVAGPYTSLNFGLNSAGPNVGSAGSVYWNTKTAGWYSDGGAGGTGTFREDIGFADGAPAVNFEASTPEPASLLLFGTVLLVAGIVNRKRRSV